MERFRGSSDLPLTPEGLQRAHEVGQELAQKGGVDRILSSSLVRTLATAQAVSKYTRAPITHIGEELHPWHLGSLEGHEITQDGLDFMHSLIKDHPDYPIPGRGPASTADGESFNSFKQRTLPFYDKILRDHIANPQERTLLVTHSRNVKLMNAWLRTGAKQDYEVDPGEMTQDSDKPGHLERISWDPHIGWQTNDVDTSSPTRLGGGIYLLRHESTPWNKTAQEDEPMDGAAS
jgi:broad specificity phosphatase PhoE